MSQTAAQQSGPMFTPMYQVGQMLHGHVAELTRSCKVKPLAVRIAAPLIEAIKEFVGSSYADNLCEGGQYLGFPLQIGGHWISLVFVSDMRIAGEDPPQPQSILQEAEKIVHGPRRKDYGTPAENHGRTATLWNGFLSSKYLGIQLTAEDVCMLNILQKVSRGANRMTRDTLVDIAGYAANIEMIEASRDKTAG